MNAPNGHGPTTIETLARLLDEHPSDFEFVAGQSLEPEELASSIRRLLESSVERDDALKEALANVDALGETNQELEIENRTLQAELAAQANLLEANGRLDAAVTGLRAANRELLDQVEVLKRAADDLEAQALAQALSRQSLEETLLRLIDNIAEEEARERVRLELLAIQHDEPWIDRVKALEDERDKALDASDDLHAKLVRAEEVIARIRLDNADLDREFKSTKAQYVDALAQLEAVESARQALEKRFSEEKTELEEEALAWRRQNEEIIPQLKAAHNARYEAEIGFREARAAQSLHARHAAHFRHVLRRLARRSRLARLALRGMP